MQQPDLVVHAGARRVEFEEVCNLPEPRPLGPRHFPIPHGIFIGKVLNALDRYGIVPELERARWALKDKPDIIGAQMFGVIPVKLDLALARDDWGFVMGLRASTDQSFAANLVAGDEVFNCDNLSFSGEVEMNRKNTRRWRFDLGSRIERMLDAWKKLTGHIRAEIDWMQSFEISPLERDGAVMDLVRGEVIGANRLKPLLAEIAEPKHEEFRAPTLWALRNNVTEVLKGVSEDNLMHRTARMNRILAMRYGRPALAEVIEAAA